MEEYPIIFEIENYPRVSVFEDSFEVRSNFSGKVLSFRYSDIKEINLRKKNDNLLYKLSSSHEMFVDLLDGLSNSKDPFFLVIKTIKGAQWEYEIPSKMEDDFLSLLDYLKNAIKNRS